MSHSGSEHDGRREESDGEEEAAFETPDMEEFLKENSTAEEL